MVPWSRHRRRKDREQRRLALFALVALQTKIWNIILKTAVNTCHWTCYIVVKCAPVFETPILTTVLRSHKVKWFHWKHFENGWSPLAHLVCCTFLFLTT
jgi:hypothetical protein